MSNFIYLNLNTWTKRAELLKAEVSYVTHAFLTRRGVGEKHPIYDFLFTYYNYSPTKLNHWTPSIFEKIEISDTILDEYFWLKEPWFIKENDSLYLNKNRLNKSCLKAADFIASLSENILNQSNRFNCFGLHEWAMVYKLSKEEIRHRDQKLRLTLNEISCFVESQNICCSHYDAYRFFTPEAKPLNMLNPTLEARKEMEQGGCLHANMDIYKWATRLWPWIGSDFILKAFLLAKEGRELDMRASPYDLSDYGYQPICIETEEGRIEYQKEQKNYAIKAKILRQELSHFCKNLLEYSNVNEAFSD